MRATGYVKKLDKSQRFYLPKQLIRELGLNPFTPIEIYTGTDCIIIEKYKDRCCICGNENNVIEFKEKYICKDCIEGL